MPEPTGISDYDIFVALNDDCFGDPYHAFSADPSHVSGVMDELTGPSNWDLPNFAGSSQYNAEAEVWGDPDNYPTFSSYPDLAGFLDFPNFPSLNAVSTRLHSANEGLPDEGYRSLFDQGSVTAPLPLDTAPSDLTLPHGDRPVLSVALAHPPASPAQPQVSPNPGDLGRDLIAPVESSLPLPGHHQANHVVRELEEIRRQGPKPSPPNLDATSSDPVIGTVPPLSPLPPPVASSSGPERTRRRARNARRYKPVVSANEADTKEDREGWDSTLARFKAKIDAMHRNVQNGRPSGGLVPMTAVADIEKLIKEDLEQSPLRDSVAKTGTCSRNVENYLKGLLRAIRRAGVPTPVPVEGGLIEEDATAIMLSNIASELEGKLAVVNQEPALRRKPSASKAELEQKGKEAKKADEREERKRALKNETEKRRRDREREPLVRIGLLFGPPPRKGPWIKWELLTLVLLFLLRGPEIFACDIIQVRSTAP